MRRTHWPVAVLVLVMSSGASCPKDTHVERKVAVIGIDVLQAVDDVGEQAKQLYTQKVMTRDQYRANLERVVRAHQLGADLADVLLAIDQGKATATQAQRLLEQLLALAPRFRDSLDGEALDAMTRAVGRLEQTLRVVDEEIDPATPEGSAAWSSSPSAPFSS